MTWVCVCVCVCVYVCVCVFVDTPVVLSLIHISEPTRPLYISYAVFCLNKKNTLKQYVQGLTSTQAD